MKEPRFSWGSYALYALGVAFLNPFIMLIVAVVAMFRNVKRRWMYLSWAIATLLMLAMRVTLRLNQFKYSDTTAVIFFLIVTPFVSLTYWQIRLAMRKEQRSSHSIDNQC